MELSLPLLVRPGPATLWRAAAFGEERYGPGRDYRWANADRGPGSVVIAQLCLAGRVALDEPGGRSIAEAGDLMLFRYGEPSAYGKLDPAEPYACRWVNLDGAGLAEHIDAFRAQHGSVTRVGLTGPVVETLGHLIALADPSANTPETTMAHAVHTFIMQLFEHAEHRLRAAQSPVEQAVARLLANPAGPWSLKQIAAEAGVSREHLSRAFAQRVGRPPHRYLTEARLRKAMQLLRDTDLPLRDVAEQSGFATPHSLARQVRAATGQAPTQYRAAR